MTKQLYVRPTPKKPSKPRLHIDTPERLMQCCGSILNAVGKFNHAAEKFLEARNGKRSYVPTDLDRAAQNVINSVEDFAVEFERMKAARAANQKKGDIA